MGPDTFWYIQMQEINKDIFQFLNSFSSHDIIAVIAPIMADLPIFFLPLFLLWMWIYYTYSKDSSNKKELLLHIFYSSVVAIIISLIIQQFVDIDRPETAIAGAGKLLLDHIPDASFPSDHASVSFAFLVALFLAGYKKVFWSFLPFVLIMNLSRIISWVHWPFDVIAWAIVWAVSACISLHYLTKIKFVKKVNLFIIKTLAYIKL